MKSPLLKKLTICLLFVLALTPVCFAKKEPNKTEPAKQNTEVLGENERIPFMQTNEPAENNESGSGGLLLRTLGAMLLIVGLIFFGAWGLKKFGFGNSKAGADDDAPDLTVLSSVSLGSGRTISTVRFGERVLLVGSTAQTFTLLAGESENDSTLSAKPRSVAEMLAQETESFADELESAEVNLTNWTPAGEPI